MCEEINWLVRESLKLHDDTNNNLTTASLCRVFKALQNEQGYTIST